MNAFFVLITVTLCEVYGVDEYSLLMIIYGYDLEHKKAGQEEINDIFSIKVMGFDIIIKNMLIAEAVLSLTEKGRNIVLMSFFLGMTDKEIGKMLHLG